MSAQRGHFERAGLARLADAVAAVLDLCDQADASLRSAVPMSAAESLIESGSHTIKVGKVRRAISKALADVDGIERGAS